MLLTDQAIEEGKARQKKVKAHHEHHDCVRIAYEWLDAQKKIKGFTTKGYAIKHLVERWAGRYVSQSDVELAAALHPDIRGSYPYFNISARLTEPSSRRLDGIAQAFTQDQNNRHDSKGYSVHEA